MRAGKLFLLMRSLVAIFPLIFFTTALAVSPDRTGVNTNIHVGSGDTLWSISLRIKPEMLSVWQTMDSVYNANLGVFLDKDPSKIISGSIIETPPTASVADQSGYLVANLLGIEVYEKKYMESRAGTADFLIQVPKEDTDKDIIEREIPYAQVLEDIVIASKSNLAVIPLQVLDPENLDEIKSSNEYVVSDVDNVSREAKLVARISVLSAEIETLEKRLFAEAEEKNAALADRALNIAGSGKAWIEFSESKLSLVILFIVLIFASFVFIRRSTGVDVVDGIGNSKQQDVFQNNSSDPTDVEGFEFTDSFNPEVSQDLDYLDTSENINPVDVKLDLAATYVDLGDIVGAKDILNEIISEANREGKARASEVLENLNSDFPE